jgi:hypothetical protein
MMKKERNIKDTIKKVILGRRTGNGSCEIVALRPIVPGHRSVSYCVQLPLFCSAAITSKKKINKNNKKIKIKIKIK